jgi:hypothetical protein
MKSITGTMFTLFLAASAALAAGIPKNHVYGEYIEARNADVYTGPCFANSEVGQGGDLAMMGWKVQKGNWQGVELDGLSVVGVIRASHTLGDVTRTAYPVKAVLIIDERANLNQRLALKSFAQRMSGDLLTDVVRVEYQPIDFSFDNDNVHSRKATLSAGSLANIRTRAIAAIDHICGNEDTYYPPLTKVNHAMPAVTVAHTFQGQGLNARWSSPDKRSAFVGTFQYQD